MRPRELSGELAKSIYEMTKLYYRLPKKAEPEEAEPEEAEEA